jgi:glycosyltransferase involved in cell wall biosynthesis
MYAPFSRNKLRNLVADSPYVIYVTKMFLQGRYPTKYGSVGISDVVLTNLPAKNRKEVRYANFDIKKPITFTSLGAVNLPHKGHHYVIEAMARLVNEGYDVNYIIVGGGDTTRLSHIAFKFGVMERVNFPGKIPHEEIFSILENTDLYLQPSDAEGLPRALIEAMSVGCACIGSNVAGIPELLDENVVFKKGNIDDLTVKIKKIFNRNVLVSQSRRNFEHAKEYEFNALEIKRREYYDKFLQNINEK